MARRSAAALALALLACGGPPPVRAIAPVEKGTAQTAVRIPRAASPSDPPLASPSPEPEAKDTGPLSILLVTVDSLRADMPWAGYPRDVAPRLTELERRCVSYERAYATASHTAPSVASILYGKYASELDRDGTFSATYPRSLTGFPHALRDAGFTVMAGHAHDYLRRAGFGSGFDTYALVPGLRPSPNVDPNQTSKPLATLATSQLDTLEQGKK